MDATLPKPVKMTSPYRAVKANTRSESQKNISSLEIGWFIFDLVSGWRLFDVFLSVVFIDLLKNLSVLLQRFSLPSLTCDTLSVLPTIRNYS